MKRTFPLLVFLAVLCFFAGCSSRNAADFYGGVDGVDLDLTRLSSTMVYSEVYNMRYDPEPYYGKVIRIEGLFSAYENPMTGEPYFNCIIPDATACCSQGLQFCLADADGLVKIMDLGLCHSMGPLGMRLFSCAPGRIHT